MQSQSISSDSPKREDKQNMEQTSSSDSEMLKEAVWFNLAHQKNLVQASGSGPKRGPRPSDTPSKRWGHSCLIHDNSMLIFGGRHSHRSLVNIYSLDFRTLIWTKLEPLGQTPPARDSHSAILYKNELIAFGGSGSGKKLNDLWSFNLETKKWSKVNSSGEPPCPREGHSCTLIRNTYMMIYGGLDENDRNISDIFLFDLRNHVWHKVISEGDGPSLRDSQSCTQINNICYIFGGQGENDMLYNDLYSLVFDINESEKKFVANWKLEEVKGILPPARTSHSTVSYNSQYLFVIAGEGYTENGVDKFPLNDVWMYSVTSKIWTVVKIKNSSLFDGRMCHSASIKGEKIYVYGGMKNADSTFENLSVLCLDGKIEELEEAINVNYNTISCPVEEMKGNFEKVKNYLNSNSNGNFDMNNDEYLFVSNNINIIPNTNIERKNFSNKEVATDTQDLIDDNEFNFENLKKSYINNMISWSFLKKLSDFNQWPLACIGNFIDNSFKDEVETKNLKIDVKCYDKKIYNFTSPNINENKQDLKDVTDFTEKILLFSIIDDGCGISTKEFNQILYSFSVNEKKEYNFFRYGVSMKTSAIRLANSFLLISKTKDEASIGLISKNLQIKLDTDFILTPIVNFKIEKENGKNKYIPRSNYAKQSLSLILQELRFFLKEEEDLFKYLNSFSTGTHIFLYDLKQISSAKNELNELTNYELLFDNNTKDILFNYFQIQIGESDYIDCSLKLYLKFLFLKNKKINVYLLGEKISMTNPLKTINQVSKNNPDASKVGSGLKYDNKQTNCLYIEGEIYKGIILNENYYSSLMSSNHFNFDNSLCINEIFNGILIYMDNRLVCRFGQNKLGDISYFIKKFMKKKQGENANYSDHSNSNCVSDSLFPTSGYLEVPSSIYQLLYNKMEFKDQAVYALLYTKLKKLLSKIIT